MRVRNVIALVDRILKNKILDKSTKIFVSENNIKSL